MGIAAGFAYKGNAFGAKEAQTTIDTNFLGTMGVCEALVPHMHKGSRIVNICSLAGKQSIIRKKKLLQRFQVSCPCSKAVSCSVTIPAPALTS